MAKKDTKLENLSKTVHMLIEEIRLSETEGLDCIFMDVYSQQANMMTDSRYLYQNEALDYYVRDVMQQTERKPGIPRRNTQRIRKICVSGFPG